MEENNKPKEKKVIKLSLQHAVLAFTSLMIVVVLGGNLYAHIKGKPNIYSAIKGLFVKEDKYAASEIVVDQTVESNGIKLTLKTVAMDENILITKYIAQGEKLTNEFYAYQEFEQDVIKLVKINLKLAEWNIMKDDPEYKDVTSKDAVAQAQLISKRLSVANLTEAEEDALMKIAKKAYQEFIVLELNPENASEKKVNELIEETIAMFESKVNSKYDVMASDTKLQEFGIQTISQKVEKSGNEYIIYNVYNVDTISDLASKFNLSVNVNKIGNIEGEWNFNTELEKARLDTRVETIDFYENNSCDNVAPAITVADNVRHTATVEAKKLVISDFSTVLMLQTKVLEKDREYYLEYAKDGLPCIFVVTDENGNVLGTGTVSEGSYERAVMQGDAIQYTDRIILENVTKDTKKIYVKIYEQYDMDGEPIKVNHEIIELDIEAARSNSKPVELNQAYTSKQHQVTFKYPGNWTIKEDEWAVNITGPEDVDGNTPEIVIGKLSDNEVNSSEGKIELKNLINLDYGSMILEEGKITVGGEEGYYKVYYFGDAGYYVKGKSIVIKKENEYFSINYYAYTDSQYARYEETFNEILETIEFLEPEKPEKSYREFGESGHPTVRLYEDNTLTLSWKNLGKFDAEGMYAGDGWIIKTQEKIEHVVNGIEGKIWGVELYTIHGGQPLPYVLISLTNEDGTSELQYINTQKAVEQDKYELEKIEGLPKNFSRQYMIFDDSNVSDFSHKIIALCWEEGQIGETKYQILPKGKGVLVAEKYVEETEDTNQEQAQQPKYDELISALITKEFNTAEYDSIKKWSDGQITIQFKEGVTSYKDAKTANIKTDGTNYPIYGIEGDIQNIYRIRNAYVGIYDALPAYVFEIKNKENKTDIYLMTLSDLDQYAFSAKGPIVSDVSEYTYIQDNGIEVITNNSEGYEISYEGVENVGKVPTKQEIYNIIDEYVTNLGEDGKKAPDLYDTKNYVNISLSKSNNNYSKIIVNVNRKEYSNGQKEIWATIGFDEAKQEWKVTDFRLQGRGGV